jgi:hypothetical protein
MANKIYQIAYNDKTLSGNDQGFSLLNNLSNNRPDWYEYWPIRNYFNNSEINNYSYLGFFSPKFKEKTGLESKDVIKFIEENKEADVISFSPFFDQSAYALNIFEQAEANHPGISLSFNLLFQTFGLNFPNEKIIMSADKTIFCNYFVAKEHVWKQWFELCEKIFQISENSDSMLGKILNSPVNYSKSDVAAKVFVVERMISLIILMNPSWKIKAYDPQLLPFANSPVAKFRDELKILNALKLSYEINHRDSDIELFYKIRSNLNEILISGKN